MKLLIGLATAAAGLTGLAGASAKPDAKAAPSHAISVSHTATPVVLGSPIVTSQPYGLPDGTGHTTVVIFSVLNRSHTTVASAPFRVTLKGGGRVLETTSGADTISLRPRERRLVVETMDPDVLDIVPQSAHVKPYAGARVPGLVLPDPRKWRFTDTRIDCNTGIVGCNVTADMTWLGHGRPSVDRIDAIVRRKSDGAVVGGGHLQFTGQLRSHRAVPLSGFVVGAALEARDASGLVVKFAVQPNSD